MTDETDTTTDSTVDDEEEPLWNPDEPVSPSADDDTDDTDGCDKDAAVRRGKDMGSTLGVKAAEVVYTGVAMIVGLLGEFVNTFGTLLPGTAKIYKRLAYAGLHGYYKSYSAADAVNINSRFNGSVELSLVKFKENLGEKEDAAGWKALGRDRIWHEGAGGSETEHIEGKTPVVMLDDDANDRYPRTVRRTAEAIACDRYNHVYEDATLQQTIVEYNPDAEEERARADGGEQADPYELIDQREVGAPDLVDLGDYGDDIEVYPDSPDGFDGTRLSLDAAKELLPEQTDAEKINDAKERGVLAGMDLDQEPNYWRPYLIATLLVLGVLFIIFVLPMIFGDGSGAGVAQRFVGG